jgi:hypothetical protein
MKRNDIKNKNYESNEKRLKEEKIWDEFNESEIKHSFYDEEEKREVSDLKISNNSYNKPLALKTFDEDEIKPKRVKGASL